MKLLLATTNVHKIREVRAILKSFLPTWDIFSLIDFPKYTPPEETGLTFEENATLKATHAAKALQLLSLADDSGIVVPALGGAPGVFSARYAGKGATDKDNRKKLLKEMLALKEQERFCYYECCLVLATPETIKKSACARCEGIITHEERGSHGFGYDSLFQKHDYSKTFGELEEDVKNRISHRRKALMKMIDHLIL